MKKTFLYILTLCVSMLFFASCSDIDENEFTSVTLPPPSDYPADVGSLTFNSSPASAACLSPALTEIICELGYGDRIAGISKYCDYPDEIKSRTVIGSSANPDFDMIAQIKPQLLITQSPLAKKDITSVESAGTRVLILSAPNSVEELYQSYVDMATVFGGKIVAQEKAETALSSLKAALDNAAGTFDSFAFIMTERCAVATGDTFAGDFLSYFGKNVAENGTDFDFSVEQLIESNPEYIILASPLKTDDLPEELQELDAVKEGRVITIDSALLERPTSRLTELVTDIAQQAGTTSSSSAEQTDEGSDESDTEQNNEN